MLVAIEFGDLPYLMASAIDADEDARALAAVNIEADLRARVDAGTLRVRNPLDLVWHTLPIGATLRRAVLLPEEAVALFRERGIELLLTERELIPGHMREHSFSTLAAIAKDAARREFPELDDALHPIEETGDENRKEAESLFLERLNAFVDSGTLATLSAPDYPSNGVSSEPLLNASGRERALELLGQLVRYDEAGHSGWSLASTAQHRAEAAKKVARQAEGFFFLSEAAQILADSRCLDAVKILDDFVDAANKGRLVFREAGSQVPITRRKVIRYSDWVHADDIDALLVEVWRVSYRFPRHHSSSVGENAAIQLGQPSASAAKNESVVDRQDRRLSRLRALRGNVERKTGGAWVQCGLRGVLTKLVAEEKADGRSHTDRRDVADDLSEAAEREHRNAA